MGNTKLQIGGAVVLAVAPHVMLFVGNEDSRRQERDLPHTPQEINLDAFKAVQYVAYATSASAVLTPGLTHASTA